jgi:uncharacterized protein
LLFRKIARKTIRKYLLLFAAAFTLYAFIEPYWLQNKIYVIASQDIPRKFNNTKILFISDIHHGPFFSISRVRSLVSKVNAENPDIILLGGDYVHRDPKYIVPCFNELKNLKAPLGVYGVLGNHDHWEDAGLTIKMMDESGIVRLDNEAVWIDKGAEKIKVGGVGDYFEDTQNLAPTLDGVKNSDFVILVSHNPDYAENLETDKTDLILSGHTHGGQVSLAGLWAPILPSKYGQKYRSGLIKLENADMIVSNGVGTITPPARLFVRPQLVTVILKRE